MNSSRGLAIGAVAFLSWEALCSFLCFYMRDYMVQPTTSAPAMMARATAVGALVAVGLTMAMRAAGAKQ